jgi:hypothetical protein
VSRSCALAVVFIALLALPDVAHACAVCFDGPGETRQAFFATTAFLTLLPLGMLAGAGAWLRSRARRADAEGRDSRSGEGPR